MPEFSSCISDMSIHVQSIYAKDTRKIFPSDCRNPRKIRMQNVQRKNTTTHQLGNNKGAHEQEAWSLNKRPTARAGHKNEGLAHNTDLQVHSRCQLAIAVRTWKCFCIHPTEKFTSLFSPGNLAMSTARRESNLI
jgi:hypothetical protein